MGRIESQGISRAGQTVSQVEGSLSYGTHLWFCGGGLQQGTMAPACLLSGHDGQQKTTEDEKENLGLSSGNTEART